MQKDMLQQKCFQNLIEILFNAKLVFDCHNLIILLSKLECKTF